MSLLVSEIMKTNFILKLMKLKLMYDFSVSALAKWILSVCLNIQHLQIVTSILPNGLHNKIARLKKLKELDVLLEEASDVKEVTLITF